MSTVTSPRPCSCSSGASEPTPQVVHNSKGLTVWNDPSGQLMAVADSRGRVYKVLSKAGAGATGAVYKVKGPDGRELAMKVLSKGQFAKAEVASLRRLRHPNVTRFEGVVESEEWREIFIFCEYLSGGELCKVTPTGELVGAKWSEADVRMVMMDLTGGVAHLHQNNVVHRDIKPENCLRRGGTDEVVLCDFGASSRPRSGNDCTRRTAGTPFYCPPETCTGLSFSAKAQDVWGLGVIMYVLLYGRVPFGAGARTIIDLSDRLEHDELVLDTDGVSVSPECCDFLRRVLEKDMTRRMRVGDMLRHRWLSGEGSNVSPLINMSPATFASPSESDFSRVPMLLTPGADSDRPRQVVFRRSETGSSFLAQLTPASERTPRWDVKERWTREPSDFDDAKDAKTLRVLVIDDCFVSRSHLIRRVSAVTGTGEARLLIEECAEGSAAVQHIIEAGGSEQYAAVLVSMSMLPFGGEEVATAIRDWENEGKCTRRIPIIGLSLSPTQEQYEAALECGMIDVLPSPTPVRMLRRVLGEVGWVLNSLETEEHEFDAASTFDVQCRAREESEPDQISPRSLFTRRSQFSPRVPRPPTKRMSGFQFQRPPHCRARASLHSEASLHSAVTLPPALNE
eukprot:Hpha_TRINITY_DN16312_c1_g7::TRINITY_DN16312_c1_g7_i1::g.59615::m.59615